MGAGNTPEKSAVVSCDVCLQEIPDSEAGIVEAEDYVMHFCGLDCYRQWRARQNAGTATDDPGQ